MTTRVEDRVDDPAVLEHDGDAARDADHQRGRQQALHALEIHDHGPLQAQTADESRRQTADDERGRQLVEAPAEAEGAVHIRGHRRQDEREDQHVTRLSDGQFAGSPVRSSGSTALEGSA